MVNKTKKIDPGLIELKIQGERKLLITVLMQVKVALTILNV